MAFIKIVPIKTNVAHTIEYIKDNEKTKVNKDIENAVDYIDNPFKNHGEYVTGIHCSPRMADVQFKMVKERYYKDDGVLGYHIIQSFKPGETTPEQAHKIGIEYVNQITKDKHQAVVSTHLDKAHIHNHIVFNSVSHIDGTKYRNPIKSYKQLKRLSDDICKEHNLSVIDMENAKNKSMSHYEWEQNRKGNSWKSQIRIDIDEIIKVSSTPKQFETLLQDRGYEIKHGAHIAFRKNGMERYARGKTLGKDYTQDAISTRIKFATLGYDTKTSTLKRTYTSNKKTYTPRKGHVTLLGTNIALTRMIIKELTKRKEYYKISKPRIKRNDMIIKTLAMQLEILREHNIITTQDLTDKITMLNAELTLLRKDIRANERKKDNVKPMNEKLFELKREISKFEKARNDITEAHKEIKKTKKIDEQQQNNRKTKDIYNER